MSLRLVLVQLNIIHKRVLNPQNKGVLTSALVIRTYTDTEQECKNIILFVYGITRSKQICVCKPDKNEYIIIKKGDITLFRKCHVSQRCL